MKRNLSIEVKDKAEFEAIKLAMTDKAVRATLVIATLVIFGYLSPLDERARQRIIRYVVDRMEAQEVEP